MMRRSVWKEIERERDNTREWKRHACPVEFWFFKPSGAKTGKKKGTASLTMIGPLLDSSRHAQKEKSK